MSFYETYPSPAWLPYTICRPSIHTRGISRTNVTTPTQIWSANPSLSFYERISRANVTAIYETQTFNTYSRYIQDQRDCHMPYTKRTPSIHTRDISRYRRDCHMPYTMRQPFNELLRGISSPTWLPYTLQWASTRHIQGQCDCHICKLFLLCNIDMVQCLTHHTETTIYPNHCICRLSNRLHTFYQIFLHVVDICCIVNYILQMS